MVPKLGEGEARREDRGFSNVVERLALVIGLFGFLHEWEGWRGSSAPTMSSAGLLVAYGFISPAPAVESQQHETYVQHTLKGGVHDTKATPHQLRSEAVPGRTWLSLVPLVVRR